MSKVIKLGNYKGIEFKVEKVPVSNEEVEQQIQMILAQSRQTEEKAGDDGYDYCICYCSGDRLCGTQTGSGICLAYCGFWRRYCIYDHYGCRRNFS